uniref:Uncharacterized protein n=1 Tax=Brassica oleracea var. oleracea TaxID=109376 RepID=A0A0D3BVT1_BRAOL
PARPFTEVDWSSLANGRAESVLGPARRTAKLNPCLMIKSVVSGLLALLRMERDKIGAAPYDGYLRTLVEGIKPFVVLLGVKALMTCFPARPLRSSLYVEVIMHVAADGILYGLRKLTGFLKTLEYWPRDKFWGLVSGCLIQCREMLETSVLGLEQDLGLIMALGGAMTTSTYVSHIIFDMIPSCFKVHDMFSAYMTCMVGFSFVCRVFVVENVLRCCKSLVLTLRRRNIFGLFADVRSQNCYCCSDANSSICDQGIRTEGDVFTQIAKDVVGQGLDHGTLTLRS